MIALKMKQVFKIFCTLFIIGFHLSTFAQSIPDRPIPAKLVNDLADVLADSEEYQLESQLRRDMDTTSTQIVVVTIKNIGAYDISDVALKILRDWGVGQKGKDNGIVILAAMENRKIWISTGYGVEGALPDLLTKRIVDAYIKPNFKKGNYFEGFSSALTAIQSALKGEFNADPKSPKGDATDAFIFLLILLAIIFLFFFIFYKASKRNGGRGVVVSSDGWDEENDRRNRGRGYTPPFIFWDSGGSRGHDDDSGGGGFGGFDFGGGSGGGGGAGGDW